MNLDGKTLTCDICHKPISGYANLAWPYLQSNKEAICCDRCNDLYVLPARIMMLYSNAEQEIANESRNNNAQV